VSEGLAVPAWKADRCPVLPMNREVTRNLSDATVPHSNPSPLARGLRTERVRRLAVSGPSSTLMMEIEACRCLDRCRPARSRKSKPVGLMPNQAQNGRILSGAISENHASCKEPVGLPARTKPSKPTALSYDGLRDVACLWSPLHGETTSLSLRWEL